MSSPLLTEIGRSDYPLPDVPGVKSAVVRGQRGKDIPLVLVKPDVMAGLRERWKGVRGIPVYAAFDAERVFWLHPAPQGEFQIDIEQSTRAALELPAESPPPPSAPAQQPAQPGRLQGTITRPVTVAK